jgi:hypothetical protein
MPARQDKRGMRKGFQMGGLARLDLTDALGKRIQLAVLQRENPYEAVSFPILSMGNNDRFNFEDTIQAIIAISHLIILNHPG